MKNLTALLFSLILSVATSQEQKLLAAKIDFITASADEFLGFDKFGYYYLIKDNAFVKLKDGKTAEYKNVPLGKITHADIDNPLLVVLFYEPFNTIVLLDNQMNEVREINFTELNIEINAHASGLASQNKLWIYDSLTQQIGLFDYRTNEYHAITTPFKENLVYYQSDFNHFRWLDEKGNQYATDVFGKVFTGEKMVLHPAMQFISDTRFLYADQGKLYLKDQSNNAVWAFPDVENSFKNFYYKDQILAIFTNGGITNYKITVP